MRATIMVEDNMISVDGQIACEVDCSPLAAEGKRAVQWYGTFGEVEFTGGYDPERKMPTRPPNEHIDDFEPYQPYIDAYEIARREKVAKEAAFLKTIDDLRVEGERRWKQQQQQEQKPG